MNENYLAIPEELANRILNYLASKPYIEVKQLIDGLQSMQKVVIGPKPETPV